MPTQELTTVFLTYSTLGGYLRDPSTLRADFPNPEAIEVALEELLKSLVEEANAIDGIQSFDLDAALQAIQVSYEECVAERRAIEAAQAGEDILEAAAIAADVALVAFSWTVFGTIGLSIAAIAAEAAAMGVEVEVQNLEGTITEMIADMGDRAAQSPALADVATYLESTAQVSLGIAKLQMGGNKAIVRQALLGLAKASGGNVADMKRALIHFNVAYSRPEDIIGKYMLLAELMIAGDGGPKADAVIAELNQALAGISDLPPKILRFVAFGTAATGLGTALKMRSFINQAARMFEDEGVMSVEEIGEVASLAAKAEIAAKAIKGLAGLGAAVEAALLVLTIVDQRTKVDRFNEAMDKRRNSLVAYYRDLHEAVTGSSSTSMTQSELNGNAMVANSGTMVEACNLGRNSPAIIINGVTFGNSQHIWNGKRWDYSTGDFSTNSPTPELDALLTTSVFQTADNLVLHGLQVGSRYRLQLMFSNDVNTTGNHVDVTIVGRTWSLSNWIPAKVSLIAEFMAPSASVEIGFSPGPGADAESGRANLNGYALHLLP